MATLEEVRNHFLRPRGLPDELITEIKRIGPARLLDVCGARVMCGELSGDVMFTLHDNAFATFERPGFIGAMLDAYELPKYRAENADLRAEIANLRARIEELELSPNPGPAYLAAKERFDNAKDGKKS